jgi:dihydrofolate reductase
MNKIVLLMHSSLDGYMAGPNGEMNWIIFDTELETYVHSFLKRAYGTVYGRNTYQMMESYWPTVLTDEGEAKSQRDYAEWLQETLKVVVSTTLDATPWNNSKLIKNNLLEEFTKLKKEIKGDLLLIGSAKLTHSLLKLGLIDEMYININPIVLGNGIPVFKDVKEGTSLKLLGSKEFKSGVVSNHYEVKA